MSIDDAVGNGDLKVGDMPHPQYLTQAIDTTDPVNVGMIKWIGVRAYSLEGQIRDFLWYRNAELGDLNDDATRREVAVQIANNLDTDIVIGDAVDLRKSDPSTEQVVVLEEPRVYGLYVEAEKRPLFNFMPAKSSRLSAQELQERVDKILAVMPYPAGGS